MADVTKAMNTVFLAPGDALAEVVPDFWKSYLDPKTPLPKNAWAYRVGGGVSAPQVTYAPDPSYPQLARQVGYQATTVLVIVVDRDGSTQNIRIVKPVGMGLDEAAV